MPKFLVTVEAELEYVLLEEVYFIEATDIETAEELVSNGRGELVHEEILEYGDESTEIVRNIRTYEEPE